MNSLAFSVGRYHTPGKTKLSTTTAVKNARTTEAPTVKFPTRHQVEGSSQSQQLQLNQDQILVRRREAIGVGFAALIGAVFQGRPTAEAAETASCQFTSVRSGLAFCDKVVGTGPEAVKGQLIKAHYVGKLENGQVFDSSYNRGKPLSFRVGVGEVIQGWDQGILGGDGVPPMQAGGKRILKLPPELGYGVRGAGCRGGSCVIPPNSVLLFDVEFIGKA
ncbi:unnamed protein product [Linum trigynum]|uniref:peptidylprolyl isomerase n=1 Tax=Linum trigynum TaxID=586398 RepID=A0AAV2FW04_9ROSI